MRGHLRSLTALDAIERRQQAGFPGPVDYDLGPAGRPLLEVAEQLELWLEEAPDGPLELGSGAAKGAIKALVDGWSTTIVRAIAARPSTLTELNKLISGINYPSLERRLGAMRLAGQIEPCPGGGRGTPYRATDWLRRAMAPLLAAARWEGTFAREESAPLSRLDFEVAFLLGVPLLELPSECSGQCRLAVVSRNAQGEPSVAGVMVAVEDGTVTSCVSRLQGEASAWVAGGVAPWMEALLDHRLERLEVGGGSELAMAVVEGLHSSVFRVRQPG